MTPKGLWLSESQADTNLTPNVVGTGFKVSKNCFYNIVRMVENFRGHFPQYFS